MIKTTQPPQQQQSPLLEPVKTTSNPVIIPVKALRSNHSLTSESLSPLVNPPAVKAKEGLKSTTTTVRAATALNERKPNNNTSASAVAASPEETKVLKKKLTQEIKGKEDKKDVEKGEKHKEDVKEKGEKLSGRLKLPIYPNITNMVEWKKKHKLDAKTKVYIVTGGYGDIKRALDKRGWIMNPDPKSPCFDLRWTIKSKESDMQNLDDYQIVNHFEKNASITTKVGLCRNLRNLVWFSNDNIDALYPRCYDLSDEKDYDDFIEMFKFNKAESILKLYQKLCKENESMLASQIEETVNIAINVCEQRLMDKDEMLETTGEIQQVKISEEDWKILSQDEISIENLAKKKYEARLAKYEKTANGKKTATKKKTKRRIIDVKTLQNVQADKENSNKEKPASTGQIDEKEEVKEEGRVATLAEVETVEKNELLEKVEALLKRLAEKDPQDGLIGDKNIWMLKPAGLSRGRGITCLKNLVEILDLARKTANQWVVQKYIENPLVIHKRKFDIRQWVLVTDWNPLTVWFYEECYVRFSGDEYNPDDLENRFVHLTNNSVVKHMQGQDDPRFENNMWRMETFREHLKEEHGRDVFEDVIKPMMKQCVIRSLESAQDMIGHRKNSFELYGYDFMVDENFNVWLIEINLSPSLDYSTPVTKRLVKMVCEDVVKVIVDYGMAKKKKGVKKSDIPTGLFSCIHKSKKSVEKPLNSYGLDLIVEGQNIEKGEKADKADKGEK